MYVCIYVYVYMCTHTYIYICALEILSGPSWPIEGLLSGPSWFFKAVWVSNNTIKKTNKGFSTFLQRSGCTIKFKGLLFVSQVCNLSNLAQITTPRWSIFVFASTMCWKCRLYNVFEHWHHFAQSLGKNDRFSHCKNTIYQKTTCDVATPKFTKNLCLSTYQKLNLR